MYKFKKMKTFKYVLPIVVGMMAFSCTNVEEPEENTKTIDYITVEREPADMDEISRTSYNESGIWAWADNDVIAIYAGKDADGNIGTGLTNYHVIKGGSSTAQFKFNGFKIFEGGQYFAFWPYMPNQLDRTKVTLNYANQICDVDYPYANLNNYDYVCSGAVTATQDDVKEVHFTVKHIGAFMRFVITMPAAGEYTKMRIENLFSEAELNMKDNGTYSILKKTGSKEKVEYTLKGLTECAKNQEVELRFMIAPQAPHEEIKVTLINNFGGAYTTTIKGVGIQFESGKAYKMYVPSTNASLSEDQKKWTTIMPADLPSYEEWMNQ